MNPNSIAVLDRTSAEERAPEPDAANRETRHLQAYPAIGGILATGRPLPRYSSRRSPETVSTSRGSALRAGSLQPMPVVLHRMPYMSFERKVKSVPQRILRGACLVERAHGFRFQSIETAGPTGAHRCARSEPRGDEPSCVRVDQVCACTAPTAQSVLQSRLHFAQHSRVHARSSPSRIMASSTACSKSTEYLSQ